jgi:hypothetical protein
MITDLIQKSTKAIDIRNLTDMAYSKNEKKLLLYLEKKKNDTTRTGKSDKVNKPKSHDDKRLRRG